MSERTPYHEPIEITHREGTLITGCTRPHPPLADPWMTRHPDGTLTITWPDEAWDMQRDSVLVSAEFLEQMVNTHNELVTKFGRRVPPQVEWSINPDEQNDCVPVSASFLEQTVTDLNDLILKIGRRVPPMLIATADDFPAVTEFEGGR